jgi:hypothetical protein
MSAQVGRVKTVLPVTTCWVGRTSGSAMGGSLACQELGEALRAVARLAPGDVTPWAEVVVRLCDGVAARAS